jgi:AcrR family transcriptional regulator
VWIVATVVAILDAAAHILEERGLEGYNTNVVAARAGVSVGSFYQYVPNKDALTAALCRRNAQHVLEAMDEAFPRTAPDDFDGGLKALTRVAVDQQLARPRLARLLDVKEARLPFDEDTRQAMAAIGERVEAVLARSGVDLDTATRRTAAEDVIHAARGLIGAAANTSTAKHPDLEMRVLAAIRGYLNRPGFAGGSNS